MSDRETLINEANELGLEFPRNIKTTKLQAMVDHENGVPEPVKETPPASPAVKAEEPKPKSQNSKRLSARAMINEKKKEAFKTRVVTLTNKDSRENEFMTTAYLSFENQHFSLSRIVPLDVPVELEESLIKVAKGVNITLHKDEVVNGQRTGNKVPQRVKKFAISYSQDQPK